MEITNDIKLLIESFTDGYALFWLYDKIEVRPCPVDMARIDPNALVECRVFDAKKEILIRRQGDSFGHRTKDDTGDYITTTAVLRGEIAKQLKGADFEGLIHLIKHEYIGYEQGVATYVDSRFVGFDIK
ncbi:MAG: hypothetical protein U0X91_27690 [Spirosomataceae bacterium]